MGKTKLNIGSSWPDKAFQGDKWINLDLVHTGGESVRANALELPFRDKQFQKVVMIHTLEHLPRNHTLPCLKEICRVTAGSAFIEVPDLPPIVEALSRAYKVNDRAKIHDLSVGIYGKSDRPGMAHLNGFDEEKLRNLMLEAGFKVITRETTMISNHYKKGSVLLLKGTT